MGELLCVRGENDLYKITEPISMARVVPSKHLCGPSLDMPHQQKMRLLQGCFNPMTGFREKARKALSFVPLASLTQSSLRMLGKAHMALLLFSAE